MLFGMASIASAGMRLARRSTKRYPSSSESASYTWSQVAACIWTSASPSRILGFSRCISSAWATCSSVTTLFDQDSADTSLFFLSHPALPHFRQPPENSQKFPAGPATAVPSVATATAALAHRNYRDAPLDSQDRVSSLRIFSTI